MGFFSKFLGDTPAPDLSGARRELLRRALRDTLNLHSIPAAWIGAETLTASTRGMAQKGIHWRLLIKHWDPELLSYSVTFQQSLISRLMALDTSADSWLMGVSWQFALPDESVCPPMPQRSWAVEPKIRPGKATAKGSLEQTFAARDAQFKHATGRRGSQVSAYGAGALVVAGSAAVVGTICTHQIAKPLGVTHGQRRPAQQQDGEETQEGQLAAQAGHIRPPYPADHRGDSARQAQDQIKGPQAPGGAAAVSSASRR